MARRPSTPAPTLPLAAPAGGARHRIGAVARMLGMPVATLRVWERRYRVTQAALTAGGQRLYGDDDIHRLALLKQLADRGHAIGSLAGLDMAQLRQVAATHAQALATAQPPQPSASGPLLQRPWRLVVIGAALGSRLQRPGLLRRLGRPVALLGPFDGPAQAAAGVPPGGADAVLVHAPQLQAGWLADFDAAAPALAALPKAVLYGFGSDAVCNALAGAGTALLRGPQPDVVLAQWLHGLCAAQAPADAADDAAAPSPDAAVPPRRWDDAELAEFAGRATRIACECPRQVAELLQQVSHFEAYSADCAHRSPADAALHRHLQQVATAARLQFEAALARVALHEGLLLPASVDPLA